MFGEKSVAGREEGFKGGFDRAGVLADEEDGVLVLGEDLGLFHAAGLVGAVLLEELEAVIHMGTEGAGGFADRPGVFYGDDGDLVGGAAG